MASFIAHSAASTNGNPPPAYTCLRKGNEIFTAKNDRC